MAREIRTSTFRAFDAEFALGISARLAAEAETPHASLTSAIRDVRHVGVAEQTPAVPKYMLSEVEYIREFGF